MFYELTVRSDFGRLAERYLSAPGSIGQPKRCEYNLNWNKPNSEPFVWTFAPLFVGICKMGSGRSRILESGRQFCRGFVELGRIGKGDNEMKNKTFEGVRRSSPFQIALVAICLSLLFGMSGCQPFIEEMPAGKTPPIVSDGPIENSRNLPTPSDGPALTKEKPELNQDANLLADSESAKLEEKISPMEKASDDQNKLDSGQDPEVGYVEPVFPQELVSPKWKRMDRNAELWLDFENKRVVVGGRICFREGYLEMFACPAGTKEHESVMAVNSSARLVHACLIALGADPGSPVGFDPEYKPANGPVIDIEVHWMADGKEVVHKAQNMVLDMNTNKAMTHDWVFGGSREFTDPSTGANYYAGDGGEFICLSNFTTATIDIPVPSSDGFDQLMFAANSENIPELGHRVLMFMKPRVEVKKTEEDAKEKKVDDSK